MPGAVAAQGALLVLAGEAHLERDVPCCCLPSPCTLFAPLMLQPHFLAHALIDLKKRRHNLGSLQVLLVRAVTVDKAELKDVYQCPVYTTESRFRQVSFLICAGLCISFLAPPLNATRLQEVATFQLKTKASWIQWTLSGVCLFLDVV